MLGASSFYTRAVKHPEVDFVLELFAHILFYLAFTWHALGDKT